MYTIMRSVLLTLLLLVSNGVIAGDSIVWTSGHGAGESRVHLYFFWSQKCPHCLKAVPFIGSLEREHPWLEVHSAEISRSKQNLKRYVYMANALGQEARSVPAFLICGRMITGYDSPGGIGQEILDLALACRQSPETAATLAHEDRSFSLPFIGTIEPEDLSLIHI